MNYRYNIFTRKLDLVGLVSAIVSLLLLESGSVTLLESGDQIKLEG